MGGYPQHLPTTPGSRPDNTSGLLPEMRVDVERRGECTASTERVHLVAPLLALPYTCISVPFGASPFGPRGGRNDDECRHERHEHRHRRGCGTGGGVQWGGLQLIFCAGGAARLRAAGLPVAHSGRPQLLPDTSLGAAAALP